MYTWIVKNAVDVAQTSIWPLFKFYDLSTHFIGYLSIIGDYLIKNTIFLDKSYELSTYLSKIYWSNNSKSW
jgi:hypothetical protein